MDNAPYRVTKSTIFGYWDVVGPTETNTLAHESDAEEHAALLNSAYQAGLAAQASRIKELEDALRNLNTYESRGSNPYGHDCFWCGKCYERVWAEARALLAKGQE